jgi:hypothetical protein
MYGQTYVQRQLGPFAPLEGDYSARVRFDITMTAVDGRIVLDFSQVGEASQDYIAIKEDCLVEIVLHGDQLFFSKEMDGITTKEELASFYGGIVYGDYDKKLDRYKSVCFHARFNSGGKYGTVHGFNVNVDFLRGFDDEMAPKWIALTIDPDIKNPPPVLG